MQYIYDRSKKAAQDLSDTKSVTIFAPERSWKIAFKRRNTDENAQKQTVKIELKLQQMGYVKSVARHAGGRPVTREKQFVNNAFGWIMTVMY